ncbi:MAG: FAD-dependent oxidoreductase [Planctomycetota bacterium]
MSAAPKRIAILGGGIAGLSTAYHLGLRGGSEVVLLEREPELARHSSAKSARLLRTAVPDEATRRLTQASAPLLREPPPAFGPGSLLDGRGLVLMAGRAGAAALARQVEAAGGAAVARRLSARELERLAPLVRSPHGDAVEAWLFAGEGRIDTDRLLAGFARGARGSGVELRTGAPAAAVLVRDGRVTGVRLQSGAEEPADAIVLAAGAWAGALGAEAGSRVVLRPTRRHLVLAAAPAAAEHRRGPTVWDVEAGFYVRPGDDGLLLCACDQDDVEPDRLTAAPEVLERVRSLAGRLLRTPPGPTAEAWAGLRTLTSDGRFAIGPDPDVGGLFWVAGLGGAGMGAGAEAGRLAARLLAGEEDPLQGLLEPSRLAPLVR